MILFIVLDSSSLSQLIYTEEKVFVCLWISYRYNVKFKLRVHVSWSARRSESDTIACHKHDKLDVTFNTPSIYAGKSTEYAVELDLGKGVDKVQPGMTIHLIWYDT